MRLSKKRRVNLIDCLVMLSLLWFNGGLVLGIPYFNATINLCIFFVCFCGIFLLETRAIVGLYRTGFYYGLVFLIIISISMVLKMETIPLDFWYILYSLMLLVYYQYLKYRPPNIQKGIQRVILADRILVNIHTCYILNVNPMLSRIFAQGGEMVEKEGYDTFLLANYGFVYSTVILLTYLFFDRESWINQGKVDRIFIAVYAVTGFLLVAKAAYTIAIVIMALFIVFSFLYRRNKPLQSTFNVVLFVLGVFCFAPLVLGLLAEAVFEGTIVAIRFEELIKILAGDLGESDDLRTRLYLAEKTIKQFIDKPLWGVFEQGTAVNYLLGRHTEWLDGLAKFGIFRYILWIVFFAKAIRETIKRKKDKRVYRGIAICIAILGFLNPLVSREVMLVLFILIPYIFPEPKHHKLKQSGGSHQ